MTPHQALESPALLKRIKRVAERIHACQPMPGRDADDIAQQIVVGVLSRAGGFSQARSTAEGFVITAARSAAMDILRSGGRAKRNPRRVRRLTDATAAWVQAPDDTQDDRDDLRMRVRRAIARMDEADAAIAGDLQRFGASGARNRLGLDRSQWVQTKDRIGLTLSAELHEKSSPHRAGAPRTAYLTLRSYSMPTDRYTMFEFDLSVPPDAIADTLEVAVAAVRGAQGETAVLLEAEHRFDPERRVVSIAAEAPAGRELSRVFHGLAARSLGADAISVTFVREVR